MNKRIKTIIIIALLAILIGRIIKCASDALSSTRPAPSGIHGHYSKDDDDLVYKTELHKDSLLHNLEKDGLVVKSGRLHHYDPPWDSLRYLVSNITCDTQRIEPYIEFQKEKDNRLTTFKILWIYGPNVIIHDRMVYDRLTKKYYDCFDSILKRHEVIIN